ncbi:MAG: signal peptidase II [Thermodesulfovibrionales bacterium]
MPGPRRSLYLVVSLLVFAGDQASKYLVLKTLAPSDVVPILPFFRLVFVTNRGAAFGSMQWLGNTFFVIVSLIAIGIVFALLLRGRENPLGLSFILGGAIGNLVDRLRFGFVVDFLDLYAGSYHWPAFNVADSFLSVGIVLILYGYLIRRR